VTRSLRKNGLMAWAEMIAAEPRLAELADEIRALRRDPPSDYCAIAAWYGFGADGHRFKERMRALVGWDRRDGTEKRGALCSAEAYAVAYDHLYGLLPSCLSDCRC
jgi:hypothetical protein